MRKAKKMAEKYIDAHTYAQRLCEHDDILIVIHSHPDGDAVGSGIALLNILAALGKKAYLACTDSLPSHLDFMSQYAIGKTFFGDCEKLSAYNIAHCYTTDIASPSLVGEQLASYMDNITLSLDHHEINTLLCSELFIESRSSSAGESLYAAIKELEAITGKRLVDKKTACALYASISSDSGNFKYSNTGSRTHIYAGELISLGAENEYICRRLFDTKSYDMLVAESICTQNAEFLLDGRMAFSYITEEEMEKHCLCDASTDTCVQNLRMIEGVEIGVFARPRGKDTYKLSMRSNDYADVSALCASFGGGGHKKAAGATLCGSLCEIKEKVTQEAKKHIK